MLVTRFRDGLKKIYILQTWALGLMFPNHIKYSMFGGGEGSVEVQLQPKAQVCHILLRPSHGPNSKHLSKLHVRNNNLVLQVENLISQAILEAIQEASEEDKNC